MNVIRALRHRLSYANITATLALFIALGGTGWAVTRLPRNSVGSAQIRTKAVGSSEIRSKAVRSSEIRDRSVRINDLATRARDALRGSPGPAGPQGSAGPRGPAGPTFHAAVRSRGDLFRGNAIRTDPGPVEASYVVGWDRDVSSCQATATLTAIPGDVDDPPPGRVTVRPNGTGIEVRTFGINGQAERLPFNLIVAC